MIKMLCPAKINLFLEVTGRRPDGYHRLDTLMGKIHLYDVLELSRAPAGHVSLAVECSEDLGVLEAGPDNLVVRAAREFSRVLRIPLGVKARLIKRIPLGAGLGGGSSDAAGTLLGLIKLFHLKLSPARRAALKKLAVSLGADVPFFMNHASFCRAQGIGERLKPVRVEASLPPVILVYPGFPVSTAGAYRALSLPQRRAVLTRRGHLDRLLALLGKGKSVGTWEDLLFNRLEEAQLAELKRVEWVRSLLTRMGLRGVRMSGSGSSVFGFAASQEAGEECLSKLRRYPWNSYLTTFNS